MTDDFIRIGDQVCLFCEETQGYVFNIGSRQVSIWNYVSTENACNVSVKGNFKCLLLLGVVQIYLFCHLLKEALTFSDHHNALQFCN